MASREQTSANKLWGELGLWPGADNRPLMGDAAKALASLSAETKAALDSGLESVKQGRPELRLIWEQAAVKQADGETTMAATTVAVTANESLPEKARRLYNEEGYTQKQVAQHVNRSDRTVRRWFNGK